VNANVILRGATVVLGAIVVDAGGCEVDVVEEGSEATLPGGAAV
jgi:hypothetical protein